MPLFDLECVECQHRWEDMVRQDVIPPCPACGAEGARKLPTVGFMGMGDFTPSPGQRVEMNLTPDGKLGKVEIGDKLNKEQLRAFEKAAEQNSLRKEAEKKSE